MVRLMIEFLKSIYERKWERINNSVQIEGFVQQSKHEFVF
ncbi:hypothetical protein RUE5091_04234 [Ruegeria denitrificans]|uniref:Uncharacterized protein n=1 Tax=Ruegeria denitrificans TaxID=1715692 RepID=A0A0P1IK37_9RHOB|nr:hypothetical protein RUE5091_04234 [Ruegeria denitrificans]